MVKILAKLLKMIGVLLLFLVLLVAAGLGVLTLLEYRPPDTETILPEQAAALTEGPSVGDSLSIVTWNMGYGALGDNADFFMDGGHMVYTADEARVRENLDGIADELASLSPDIFLRAMSMETDTTESSSSLYPSTFLYTYSRLWLRMCWFLSLVASYLCKIVSN